MTALLNKQTAQQLFRYLQVGFVSNIVGYFFYLVLTFIGLSPFQGMALVYVLACSLSFVGNRNWTFGGISKARKALPKYIIIQALGYLTNFLMLLILYRQIGLPHQLVQLFAVAVVAAELFLLSKYYVFK